MIEYREFEPNDLLYIDLQDGQKEYRSLLNYEYGEWLRQFPYAYTAWSGQRRIAACGMAQLWKGRAYLWCFISKQATGADWISLFRFMQRFWKVEELYFRVETTVREDFEQGHRLMKMLGFEKEGAMKAYWLDGSNHDLYARIKWELLPRS